MRIWCLTIAVCAWTSVLAQDGHTFQWRFETATGSNVFVHDALPLDDKGYLLSGLYESPAGSALYFPFISRLDCKGQVLWAKSYNQSTETANNVNGRVLRLPSGDFVLVSNVGFFFTTPHNDIFLARVDPEGNTVWTRRIGGGTNNQDLAQAAIVTTDGNIVLAGQTGSWGTDANTNNVYTDQYFMKLNPDGEILWTRTLGNPQKTDRSFDIVELPDESLAAAGSYIHTGGTFYANLVKMDKNGTVLWHKAYGEGVAPQANHAYGVTAAADGGLLVTGSSTNLQTNFQGYSDLLIIKTDAGGVPQWSRVVTGGNPDLFENASNAVQMPGGNFAVMCATSSYPTVGFVGNKYGVLTLTPSGDMASQRLFNFGSSHYPRLHKHPQEDGYLISGFSNWTEYGGNGNRFDPLLINTDRELKVGCFNADFTNLTTAYNPAFDIDDAPGVSGTGGAILNAVVTASSFDMTLDVSCESAPYETCAPFSETAEQGVHAAGFSVRPNPARAGESVSLYWEGAGVETVFIYDQQGRLVQQQLPVPGTDNVEIRLQQPGVYWVCLKEGSRLRTEKLVILSPRA